MERERVRHYRDHVKQKPVGLPTYIENATDKHKKDKINRKKVKQI